MQRHAPKVFTACFSALDLTIIRGMKMKTHRAAIEKLFTANDLVLDADEIYLIAQSFG